MIRMKKTDDDRVKAELVSGILTLAREKKWDLVVQLSKAYTDLRKMETRQDEGSWGSELEELVRPADSKNVTEVRS